MERNIFFSFQFGLLFALNLCGGSDFGQFFFFLSVRKWIQGKNYFS